MINDFQLTRMYTKGFSPDDHLEVRPNSVILAPIHPPKTAGGILQTVNEIRGTHCVAFRVTNVGPQTRDDDIQVSPGDCVIVRMMYVDPLHPNELQLQTDTKHILSVIYRHAQTSLIIK